MKKYDNVRLVAIKMRQDGASIVDICTHFNLSKGTVYPWIKNIPLNRPVRRAKKRNDEIISFRKKEYTNTQIAKITGVSQQAVGRFLKNAGLLPVNTKEINIKKWQDEATSFFHNHKSDPIFMLGIGLYWGEGNKIKNLAICNSDYGIIRNWLIWCEKFIPNRQLRFALAIHAGPNKDSAIAYWKDKCSINEEIKVYFLASRSKKDIEIVNHKMPNGVMRVMVSKGAFEELVKMKQYLNLLSI